MKEKLSIKIIFLETGWSGGTDVLDLFIQKETCSNRVPRHQTYGVVNVF